MSPQSFHGELGCCEVFSSLHCIQEGAAWCYSKKGICCNPNTGWCGEKSHPWGLLSSSHLSTEDKRYAPQEHARFCKRNNFSDGVLLVITSQLSLKKEMGHIGTKPSLSCQALWNLFCNKPSTNWRLDLVRFIVWACVVFNSSHCQAKLCKRWIYLCASLKRQLSETTASVFACRTWCLLKTWACFQLSLAVSLTCPNDTVPRSGPMD